MATVQPVAEIGRLEVFAAAPGVRIDLTANEALVWTTYRDSEGDLVIELPNARPGGGVVNRAFSEGLISSIRVSAAGVPSRPMTRLVIATRESAEHRLDARGSALRIDMVPSGMSFPTPTIARAARVEPPVSIASAPAPAPQRATTPAPMPAAPEMSQTPATPEMTTPEVTAQWQSEPAPAERVEVYEPAAPALAGMPLSGTPENPIQSPPPSGIAASTLTGVQDFGSGTVWIAGDGEFSFSTFRLENPERFVIDLDGVINRSDRGTLPIDDPSIARVRISQFRSRPTPVARVVFDLAQPSIPAIDRDARGLTVRFGGEAAVAAVRESSTASPLNAPSALSARSAPETAAVARYESPTPDAISAQVGTRPAAYASAEAPGVATVDSYQPVPEPAAQMAITDVTAYEPSIPPAQTTELEATASTRPAVADFEAQDVKPMGNPPRGEPRLTPAVVSGQTVIVGKKEYSGEPISMSLKDADVREVLRTFARLSGLNVVIQPGVRGTVTVELERVPWDQALDIILRTNGLGYELEGNIMRVAPSQVLAREASRARALQAAQALSVPLRTVIKRISYAKASQIASLLKRGSGGVMSKRASVVIDARTNTLILKELPNYIDTVLAVIETLDTPEPQVMIEARIVETTKQFSRSLGIRWGFTGVADQAHGNATGLQFPYHGNTSGGVSLLTGGANGFIDLALGNVLDTFTLNARLQIAESEGLLNVLSAPKIATLNNSSAQIQSGLQLPVQTTTNNTTSVQFVNATLKLRVTPHVTAEGTVMMDINVQKREPQFAFQLAGAPSAPISTKEARTRVIVRDGGTTVIGGIYKVTSDEGQDRVPGLANVPLLGRLFKNRRVRNDNDELLIFITPRVVKL